MKAIQRPDQYLRLRGDIWHYVRRVPKAVRHVDERTLTYRSLETDSRKLARQRRDVRTSADDQRWNEIAPGRFGSPARDSVFREMGRHAQSLGFTYQPIERLVSQDTVEDLLRRLEALAPLKQTPATKEERDAEALLSDVSAYVSDLGLS